MYNVILTWVSKMCEHNYIVIDWKLSVKKRVATQLLCSKCLDVIDYDDLLQAYKRKSEAKAKLVDLNLVPAG